MKKLLFLLVVLALGGAGFVYVKKYRVSAASDLDQAAALKTVKAEIGNIDLRVSTTGKIISNLDVDIKSKASGQITRLPFDISQSVKQGELLAELDPVDENKNVAQREANLNSAKARLAQAMENYKIALISLETETSSAQAELSAAKIRNDEAQAKLERQQDLNTKKLISQEELDTAESAAATAKTSLLQATMRLADTMTLPRTVEIRKQDIALQESAVKTAEVDLENAMQRLRETKIYAPVDGVVTQRTVQTGQIIASGVSNVGGGTTLMTLSDLSRLFVSANVDESDIGKVNVDQRAIVSADAYPGRRFRGKVVRIAPKGQNTQNVVTFEVKIEIEGEGKNLLKPEMTANVDIQCERHENVLVLPNEAVQFGKEGYFVELPDGPDKTKKQPVKTALTDGLFTEIADGLKEGEEVSLPSILQSKWAQSQTQQGGPGQRTGAQNFQRGMQRAAFGLSGAGGRPSGGGRGR